MIVSSSLISSGVILCASCSMKASKLILLGFVVCGPSISHGVGFGTSVLWFMWEFISLCVGLGAKLSQSVVLLIDSFGFLWQ